MKTHECPECFCECDCMYSTCIHCDDEHNSEHSECEICGLVEGHDLKCPHNDSPFGNLIREGFD